MTSAFSTRRAAASSGRLRIAARGGAAAALVLATAGAAPAAPRQAGPGARARATDATRDTAPAPRAGRDTGAVRTVRGRVVRPAGRDVRGLPGVWVVLHRVGTEQAGPLDSLRSGADGGYRFRYRATGSDEAIYFVSAGYGGVAYFTQPLRQPDVNGDDAEITVFDTTSHPVPLRVAGRHLVVSSLGPEGSREIVEVYELSNDTTVTVISPDDARPTWTATLPEGATDFRSGEGDVSAAAVRMANGRVAVVAPFAPGLKQVSFAYRLPRSRFPLSVPLPRGAEVLEVLLEDSTATVSGAHLQAMPTVRVEGRTFRRFLAHDAPANSVVRVTVPAAVLTSRTSLYVAVIAIALGVAMLAALARTFARPRSPLAAHRIMRGVPAPSPADDADALAGAIVTLDREFEASSDVGASERAAYESSRSELKQRLARVLAAQRGAG